MEKFRFNINKYKIISPLSLAITLLIVYILDKSMLIMIILLVLWYFLFRPYDMSDIIMFIIATVCIVGQNYAVLKSGGFYFKQKDILLMPYYEPFMWGFYYLNIKRFFSGSDTKVNLELKGFFGLALTGLCFSVFSQDKSYLLLSTIVSTCILIIMFHDKYDIYYGLYALIMGFIVEIFGVSTSLWVYPDPDFMGIPYWFSTMWISMGILGRRFLLPFTKMLSNLIKFSSH